MIRNFVVRIEKVHAGSSLRAGTVFEPIKGRLVIGRAATAEVRLNDMSIAREHVLIESTEAGFSVQNLTTRGTTFVNAQRIAPDESVEIAQDSTWLQVGPALLEVTAVAQTMKFSNMLSLPMRPDQALLSECFIRVQHQPFLRIWVDGHLVSLFPSAARVLARLCETPGELVLQEELLETIDPEFHLKSGGANLHQNMTYIRDMFDTLIASKQISEQVLRSLVEASGPDGARSVAKAGRRGILRAVVANIRGAGYCLRLPPSSILVEGSG